MQVLFFWGKWRTMIEIFAMTQGHALWDKTIAFAQDCTWKAGPYLAELMIQDQFLEWERVFVARDDKKIVGFCTFVEKDELPEEYDVSPFVGFVFVDEKSRGKRISEMMIKAVIKYANGIGYDKIYIMSGEQGLYEKYGFKKIGDYETIYGSVDQLFVRTTE